jgi:hypothetical protein
MTNHDDLISASTAARILQIPEVDLPLSLTRINVRGKPHFFREDIKAWQRARQRTREARKRGKP